MSYWTPSYLDSMKIDQWYINSSNNKNLLLFNFDWNYFLFSEKNIFFWLFFDFPKFTKKNKSILFNLNFIKWKSNKITVNVWIVAHSFFHAYTSLMYEVHAWKKRVDCYSSVYNYLKNHFSFLNFKILKCRKRSNSNVRFL